MDPASFVVSSWFSRSCCFLSLPPFSSSLFLHLFLFFPVDCCEILTASISQDDDDWWYSCAQMCARNQPAKTKTIHYSSG